MVTAIGTEPVVSTDTPDITEDSTPVVSTGLPDVEAGSTATYNFGTLLENVQALINISTDLELGIDSQIVQVSNNLVDIVNVALNNSNITINAHNIADINTLAGGIAAINSLYTDKIKLDSLYADKAKLDSIFADKSKLDSLFTDKATLDSLYADKAKLDSLFADKLTLDRLHTSIANIDAVGLSIANVDKVATDIINVNSVATIISDIVTVSGDSAAIQSIATTIVPNIAAILLADDNAIAAANSASAAQTAETNAQSHATNAAATLVSVQAIFDSFDDRYLGSKTADPTVDNDGFPLVPGQIYWNSVATELRFYNGAAWEAPSAQAATSATNALASETAALGYRNETETFKNLAATSEANALAHKNAAGVSETNAGNFASLAEAHKNAAALSETNAGTSETNAGLSETKAGKWAEEAEDIEVELGKYSAKHWALKAEGFASGVTFETLQTNGDVGTGADQLAVGNHTHAGYEPAFTKNTAFNKNFGSTVGTVSEGNHGHSGVYEPVITKLTAFNKNFGTTVGTVAEGNDSRILNGATAFSWGDHGSAGYLLASAYTAADVLAKLLTVDGAGSGVDADTIDGIQGASLLRNDSTQIWHDGVNAGLRLVATTDRMYLQSLNAADSGAGELYLTGKNGTNATVINLAGDSVRINGVGFAAKGTASIYGGAKFSLSGTTLTITTT